MYDMAGLLCPAPWEERVFPSVEEALRWLEMSVAPMRVRVRVIDGHEDSLEGYVDERAISVSDLPSRRTEKSRMTKSCTHPPKTAPARIQSVPGR